MRDKTTNPWDKCDHQTQPSAEGMYPSSDRRRYVAPEEQKMPSPFDLARDHPEHKSPKIEQAQATTRASAIV